MTQERHYALWRMLGAGQRDYSAAMFTVTPLKPHELPRYFADQQQFYGLPEPQERARRILSQFDAAEQQELAQDFLVLRGEDGGVRAGLGVSGGKYVQGFYAASDPEAGAHWPALLQALRAQGRPLRVYLNAHPERLRPPLAAALEGAGFTRHTDYDLVKSLFGASQQAAPEPELHLTNWDDSTEAEFRAVYERLAGPLDPDWDTVYGIGEFVPALWFVGRVPGQQAQTTLFGIGGTRRPENRHIYHLRAAFSFELSRAAVISVAEAVLAEYTPDAVLHVHASEPEVAELLARGYAVNGTEDYWDVSAG
ncbi:hypothetical protein ACFP81_00680 [Deinococcus lacus]|uniref:N-acetyltransferase domain-containing protein n=1 Tax=Deinococcus lacus TaxID=392561 RepID=A0ABW1Y8S5_9DEIO